ncbi:hypothetical protein NC661_03795 [Aquibacillus koreensis]|uniref:Uncharacterized protein n=1 Tax=Aquibacillus koreensis TaxID=279446 RepID=A0A9X4AH96_9BACI|nr:hypothetical protein [Aquibacillus koreensis]MCT2536426.1 hypothetical protein [Aquibacillus koreensis]MDC3419484.1 hypothetical protein [Aquibacillus koreensis]
MKKCAALIGIIIFFGAMVGCSSDEDELYKFIESYNAYAEKSTSVALLEEELDPNEDWKHRLHQSDVYAINAIYNEYEDIIYEVAIKGKNSILNLDGEGFESSLVIAKVLGLDREVISEHYQKALEKDNEKKDIIYTENNYDVNFYHSTGIGTNELYVSYKKNSDQKHEQKITRVSTRNLFISHVKNFEQYMWFQDIIVVGTVIEQGESYHKLNQDITPSTIRLNETLTGNVDETFTIIQSASKDGKDTFVQPGEQYIFFLRPKSTIFNGHFISNKWRITDGKVNVIIPTDVNKVSGFESDELDAILDRIRDGLKNKEKPEYMQ